jgi:hypothetical protein
MEIAKLHFFSHPTDPEKKEIYGSGGYHILMTRIIKRKLPKKK